MANLFKQYLNKETYLKKQQDITVSGSTVIVPAGYYESETRRGVGSGVLQVRNPTIDSSTGIVTASGYVTSGYLTSQDFSKTLQLDTQSAKTVTPSSSSQTAVAAGKYTTGAVTVEAVPTETNTMALGASAPSAVTPTSGKFLSSVSPQIDSTVIKAENIAEGVTLLGILGTHQGGSSGYHIATIEYADGTQGLTITDDEDIPPDAKYYGDRSTTSASLISWLGLKNDNWNNTLGITGIIPGDTVYVAVNVTDWSKQVYMLLHVKTVSGTTSITADNDAIITPGCSYMSQLFTAAKFYSTRSWDATTCGTYCIVKNERWTNTLGVTGVSVGDIIRIDVTNTTTQKFAYLLIKVTSMDGTNAVGDALGFVDPDCSFFPIVGGTPRTSADLTVSGATVTVPDGYYSATYTKSVASGSATTPATSQNQSTPSLSVNSSTGVVTATVASKTFNVTPTVSAGYVSSGTAGTITLNSSSGTLNLSTKSAQTYTPGTSNQTISSGKYLTGTQTISGDSNLVAGNIKNGVTIFGVTGTYSGGGGGSYDIWTNWPAANTNSTSSSMTALGDSFTVTTAGSYKINASIVRSSTSNSGSAKIYKNGSEISGASTSWNSTNSNYSLISTTQTLAVGDVISVKGRSSSSRYYISLVGWSVEKQ